MTRFLLADVYVAEDGDRLRFGNDEVELRFDLATGNWLELRDQRRDEAIARHGDTIRPLELTVGGRTTVTTGRNHLWSLVDTVPVGPGLRCLGYATAVVEGRARLTLQTAEGPWQLEQHYTLGQARGGPAAATIKREVTIGFAGEATGGARQRGPALLRWLEFRLPWIDLGAHEEVFVEAPGYSFPSPEALTRLPLGRWPRLEHRPDVVDGPSWRPGLIALSNPTRAVHLLTWAYSETEPCVPAVYRGDAGVRLAHRVLAADRFRAGHRLDVGAQYVRVSRGQWLNALRGFQQWYGEAGVVAAGAAPGALATPAWARRAHIYEVHLGAKSFDTGEAYAPFARLEELVAHLPVIQQLGFDVVQLMPRMPYPSYTVVDYHDVDTHYGSADGLRSLVRRAHELGMRVVLDVVVHGERIREEGRREAEGRPGRYRYLDSHPEWFCRTEDGRVARASTWAFDLAHPGLQRFLAQVLQFYVREFGVDGFRVDAPTWNNFPTWAEGLPYRASASHLGGARLFERVRADLRAVKPDVVLYAEATGPLFRRAFDLAYNYDEQWLFGALMPVISSRGFAYGGWNGDGERITARDLERWLEARRLALPVGSITVHHLDSHDTHEWGGLGQFRREAFGPGAAQALFALCCFVDGAVMSYAGAEDGSEVFYRTLLRLRREVPALQGVCDYAAVEVDDEMVFAPLWTGEATWAIPAVNLAPRPATVTLTLPLEGAGLSGEALYRVRDVLGEALGHADGPAVHPGRDLAQLHLGLGPFGLALLTLDPT